MSTHINDLGSGLALSSLVAPAVRTASVTGSAVDMISADGACFAIQQVGALTDAAWLGTIQESADGSTGWASITEFVTVEAANNVQAISFRRTKRYLRYTGGVSGGSPSVAASAVVGEQLKTF